MQINKRIFFLLSLFTAFILFNFMEGFMCFCNDYENARIDMIEKQIKARGITNEDVLKAMLKIERHKFVPDIMKPLAYKDRPLPIGEGQTISQPYIVALMSELIISDSISGETILKKSVKKAPKKLKILEIGTGSGYQAAVLAAIGHEIYTIEIIKSLGKNARKLLKESGYDNVSVKTGDGYKGWPEKAPFDRIIVTCAPGEEPKALLEQLNPEGGRMIIPIGPEGETQKLVLIKRRGEEYIRDFITYVMFVPMIREKK